MLSPDRMDPATDLIEHFKLDVVLFPDHTRHTFYHSDGRQNRRKVKVVRKWIKQQELGEGGGGTVWLEKDGNGDERAVKQISKGFCLRNGIDYKKEITAMAKLTKHPELFVELHGWFDDDTSVFLAMEYFKHGDLQNFMNSPLPERDVGIITRQLLEGLNVMHKHGFTHRDLKPQLYRKNIFVVADLPTWWVKIGDFGIAKRIMDDQTALRTEVGTRDYQAPEVFGFMDSEEELLYTSAVDLWALGCVMYRLLTFEKPFPKPSSLRLYCYGEKDFPVEPLYAKDVSEDAVEIIRQLMRVHPPDRLDAETALKSDWLDFEEGISGSETDSIAEEQVAAKSTVHEDNTLPTQAIMTTTSSQENRSGTESETNSGSPRGITIISHAPQSKRVIDLEQARLPLGFLPMNQKSEDREQDSAALEQLHRAGYCLGAERITADLSTTLDATKALHRETKSGHLRELKCLLDTGVDATQKREALHYAASGGLVKEVDVLIEKGADVQQLDAESCSPLHYAAVGGNCTISEALLKAGASVHSRNWFQETPLHCAASHGHIDVIVLLLDWGADISAKDLSGFTPFDPARQANCTVEALRSPELKKGQSESVGKRSKGFGGSSFKWGSGTRALHE